jgi:hypothetical protein
VGDLHNSLVKIQQQREIWNRFVDTGHPPTLPGGLGEAHVAYQEVEQDLAELDRVLGISGPGTRLADMTIAEVYGLLGKLAEESEILQGLERRQEVADHLANWHLQPLVDDLATRHVAGERVAAELELAWWRGALETILQKEEALLGSETAVLERLEADFRLVDEAHTAGNAQRVAWQLAERWSLGLMDWPDERSRPCGSQAPTTFTVCQTLCALMLFLSSTQGRFEPQKLLARCAAPRRWWQWVTRSPRPPHPSRWGFAQIAMRQSVTWMCGTRIP